MLEMTGGEALARALRGCGAEVMFGMGGFQLLPFYDAVRRLGLDHTLINDERCGIFAADAWAKITGKVGVVDATLGPGAANLVTGLVEALNAGTAIVAIVADSHRDHSWKNMTQEARQVEILRPAAKELIRIESIKRIPELIARAFHVATAGRPGPVVVDIPEDVCHDIHEFSLRDFDAPPGRYTVPASRCRPDRNDLAAAVDMLKAASRPLILAGGGVHISGAATALQTLAETATIPVAHTMTGKGAIACTHPLSAGLFGRYDRIANDLIEKSDCLLVIGCKLGEIATKRYTVPGPGKPIIHVDLVAEEFERTNPATLRLWGDARATIEDLTGALKAGGANRKGYADEVANAMKTWRLSVKDRLTSTETPINMARLMHEISQALPDDGLLVADGGFAAHWGGLIFDTKMPGRFFVPDRGFASIGYGLPGAMGAALAAPGGQVISVTGDGGFNMVAGELETALRLKLGFTLVIVNNAASGYVKALQHLMYGAGNYQSSDLSEINYAEVARSYRCHGIRVTAPGEIAGALATAMAQTGCPTIVDVVVTRDPAKMLPAVDNRTTILKKGDRVA
ncbi:Acetolactate synthase large subunit homolog [hydrothermal vent metagenome]|uniref:Acetolactate synthase large subunit homolog n=1 Tax=hydrothermal vent metagenome TaxID=652676 RepID=A0A3B0TAA3_9ZZZZ